MHSLEILYRDVKPENILIDHDGHCLISDLGLAKIVPGLLSESTKIEGRAGTPGFWPPEMIRGEPYGYEADWWSFGCLLFALIEGHCPFSKSISKMKSSNEATLNWKIKIPTAEGGASLQLFSFVLTHLIICLVISTMFRFEGLKLPNFSRLCCFFNRKQAKLFTGG